MLAVVAFHEQFSGLPGGFLGVDVFFVISGYLITDLLAAPWEDGGRLDLRGFWVRRARRLLPCLAVMLVTVTAAVAVLEPDELPSLRPALLAALTYTSNWWQALQHQSYFSVFGPPPPLQHLWSLAIEEQFYLIWPVIMTVILAACRRRRTRAAVVWLGAAASAIAMAACYLSGTDVSRLYYGTDTHATALLVGAGLALGCPLRRIAAASAAKTRRLDLLGLAGAGVLAWELTHVSGNGGAAYLGGFAVAALAAGTVVIAAAGTGLIGRALAWAPLRWVGIRSYGIYLWHWPVIALFAARAGSQSATFGVRLAETAVAIVLAAASWRWVEAPILRDGFVATVRSQRAIIARSIAAARQSPRRMMPALLPLAAITVLSTAGYGVLYSPSGPSLQQQLAAGTRASAASVRHSGSSQHSGSVTRPGPVMHPGSARQQPGSSRHARSRTPSTALGRPGTAQHLAFPPQPDSLVHPASAGRAGSLLYPASLRGARVAWPRRGVPQAPVSLAHLGRDVTAIGDSVMLASAPELRAALSGSYIDALVSRQMSQGIEVARQLASRGELRPILVVGLGTNGPITMGQVRALRQIAGPGRELVLVNTFVPRPWQPEVNGVIAAAARRYHDVTVANWLMTIRNRTGLLWGDGVHPQPAGGVVYARMLAAAVRRAAVRLEGSAGASRPH